MSPRIWPTSRMNPFAYVRSERKEGFDVAKRLLIVVSLLVLVNATNAHAQVDTQDFTDWMQKRLQMATAPLVGASTPGKQVETPSIADSSSTLVDKAGAPDLIGIALQFFNLGKDSEGAPASVTLSAFTLRTAILGLDPNRPEVYADGRHWRRVSGSFGRESADATTGVGEAQLIGVKFLVWDRRDPTRPENVAALQDALRQSSTTLEMAREFELVLREIGGRLGPRLLEEERKESGATAVPQQFGEEELQTFLEERLGAGQHAETLKRLTADDLAAVDTLLIERVAPIVRTQREAALHSIKALKQAPQLSLSYQAKLRDDDGADEHAWQGMFDYGVANRMSISVNVALSRLSRPITDATMGGRVAFEAQFQLTGGGSSLADLLRVSAPLTLSTSYAGEWDEIKEDVHKLQAKLTIPLPALLKGLSLPVSVTVASRRELIDEAEVRGQVGFTIDFSTFQQALRSIAR